MSKKQNPERGRNTSADRENHGGSGLATSTCSADLSPEQIELAENLGSFLWESSTLRHGLFTPPEFSRLVRNRIKQYFFEQNGKDQSHE